MPEVTAQPHALEVRSHRQGKFGRAVIADRDTPHDAQSLGVAAFRHRRDKGHVTFAIDMGEPGHHGLYRAVADRAQKAEMRIRPVHVGNEFPMGGFIVRPNWTQKDPVAISEDDHFLTISLLDIGQTPRNGIAERWNRTGRGVEHGLWAHSR